jgi:hypothetical protein
MTHPLLPPPLHPFSYFLSDDNNDDHGKTKDGNTMDTYDGYVTHVSHLLLAVVVVQRMSPDIHHQKYQSTCQQSIEVDP